jgi:hypothetical protein
MSKIDVIRKQDVGHRLVSVVACLGLIWGPGAWAVQTLEYHGTARVGDRIAYREHHRVETDDAGKLVRAKTLYSTEQGKPIAELDSDFRESLAVPSHTIQDFRTGNVEGLRREGTKVLMFDRPSGQPERTRALTDLDIEKRLLVGCQGLNYYLLDQLDNLSSKVEVPLRFLIPGKLDYYDFKMQKTDETQAGLVEFEITLENWLLKLFAPNLLVKYDKKAKRIAWYRGLSNLKAEDGNHQVVTITYSSQRE